MQIINQTWNRTTKSRHKRLLKDPDVKRWYQNIARGSTMTADVRLRRLGVYCERTNMTPMEFAHIGIDDVRKDEDILLDYVSFLEKARTQELCVVCNVNANFFLIIVVVWQL